jgi:hypothetical protein
MLKKYGTLQEVVRVVGRKENKSLIHINRILDSSHEKFELLISQLNASLISSKNRKEKIKMEEK